MSEEMQKGEGGIDQTVSIPENWKDLLPDELRNEPVIDRFNDVPAMAKALVSAQRMVGADKIAIPAADDKEGWNAVYDRLGRPRTADGYELSPPEGLPDGFAFDEGVVTRFREEAHKLGLSGEQTAGLYRWFLASEGNRFLDVQNQIEALRKQSNAELRQEWGGRFDEKVSMATEAARVLLGDEGVQRLQSGGYTSDALVMRLLSAVGERVVEGRVDGDGSRTMGRSPAEARGEIARLHGDRVFIRAYQDRAHPDHDDAVARMAGLYEQAYPSA